MRPAVTNLIAEPMVRTPSLAAFMSRLRVRMTGAGRRSLTSSPALRPRGPLDRPEEIGGAALEGLVAQHLRAWMAYSGAGDEFELFTWRTRTGVEVDFVIYGEGGFWAVDVMNSAKVRSTDVKALQSFVGDYPECTPVLLYRGQDRLLIGDVRCLPVEEFLVKLIPGQPLAG